MRRAVAAGTASARRLTPLASRAAVRVSPIMSRSLLLAEPSVPSATLMPASSSFCTGQKPLASFRLDSGQCTTWLPVSASHWISSSSSWVMCTASRRGLSRPSCLSRVSGRSPLVSTAWWISPAVSCTCIITGASSSSAKVSTFSRGPSETV